MLLDACLPHYASKETPTFSPLGNPHKSEEVFQPGPEQHPEFNTGWETLDSFALQAAPPTQATAYMLRRTICAIA